MLVTAIVLMQFMISAKAGLVNYVEGQVNVRLHEQIPVGMPIQTGSQSHVEILLNPGSFLRLDQNSTVVLDSVELTSIAVRVVAGAALIESAEDDKQTPIRATTGRLETLILSPGVYRFSGDSASVIEGKLRTTGSSLTVKKGYEVTAVGSGYEKSTMTANVESAELDRWSRQRSSELARANAMAYRERPGGSFYSYSAFYPNGGLFPNGASWLYSPVLSGFTFIPHRSYRSHWGYSFVPLFLFAQRGFSGSTARVSRSPITPQQHPEGRVSGPRSGTHAPATAVGPRRGPAVGRSSSGGPRAGGSRGGMRGRR